MSAVRLEVTGRVQGVGFRWFVREYARRAGLSGWVKNLPNGNVEIVASGDDELLRGLRAVARQGPPGARVELVIEGTAGREQDLPQPFSVLR